jgi:hypothetical protein
VAVSVVHDIPGRLRLRLPPTTPGADLGKVLSELAGVVGVRWSRRTRSLVVSYRPDLTSARSLLEVVGVRAPGSAGSTGMTRAVSPAHPRLATAVAQAVSELNSTVGRATGGLVDLRTLAPLVLVAWAIREIARGSAGPLAWSAALWYAHGLFRDYALPAGPA